MSGKNDSPASSNPPWICCAVREEAAFLRPAPARLLLTGIGPANARRTLQRALGREKPPLLLSCGFAGGLNPNLPAGTLLFSADESFPCSARLAAAGARPARFHLSQRVICSAAEKAALRQATGADAVDMESEIIRSLCRERAVPSATLRVISDAAHEDLPIDFNLILTPRGQVHPARLFAAFLKRPRLLADLMKLRRQTRAAARLLAQALRQVLTGPGTESAGCPAPPPRP